MIFKKFVLMEFYVFYNLLQFYFCFNLISLGGSNLIKRVMKHSTRIWFEFFKKSNQENKLKVWVGKYSRIKDVKET